ncbi:MAG: response regulator [Nitrospira sp. CR1.1]|nr:response regulator [Nitrospira sp. CR1.1]
MMQDLDLTTIKILLVDDEAHCTKLMEAVLKQAGYSRIVMTNDSRQAVSLYQEGKPDLVALDMRMPHMDGCEVMRQLRQLIPAEDYVPILIITGELDAPTKHKALAEGANDFINKPVDATEVVLRIKNQLETRRLHRQIRMHNEHLEAQVRLRTRVVEQTQLDLLNRLVLASEYRYDAKGAHAWRVGRVAMLLADMKGLPPDQVDMIKKTAPLHDVGKIGLLDSIVMKEGAYTAVEREAMKTHTKIGSKLLADSQAPLLMMAREIALTHHERWDGAGYHRLKEVQTPLSGRIVALADAFDIMTHACSYKATLPLAQARAEIERNAGTQFDPELSALFLKLIDREGENLLADATAQQLFA